MLFALADCAVCRILLSSIHFIAIMYISSPFAIDSGSSDRQCSHIAIRIGYENL